MATEQFKKEQAALHESAYERAQAKQRFRNLLDVSHGSGARLQRAPTLRMTRWTAVNTLASTVGANGPGWP